MFPYIDRRDWAFQPPFRNAPWPILTAEGLARLNRCGWGPDLTRRHLEEHLAGSCRYFFQGSARSQILLIMIDVQHKCGTLYVANVLGGLLRSIFPDAYVEPAIDGWHFYVLVDKEILETRDLIRRLRLAQARLRMLAQDAGSAAKVTIRGITKVVMGRRVICRGDFAPLPRSSDAGRRLAASPVFSIWSLELHIHEHFQQINARGRQREAS